MRSLATTLIVLLLPSLLVRPFLRILGHKIGKNVRLGFTIIRSSNIELGDGSRIGHFNLLKLEGLVLGNKTKIKHFNILIWKYKQ